MLEVGFELPDTTIDYVPAAVDSRKIDSTSGDSDNRHNRSAGIAVRDRTKIPSEELV